MQRNEFHYETSVKDLQALQTFMLRRVMVQNRQAYAIAFAGVVLCALFLTAVIVASASTPRLANNEDSALVSYLALVVMLLTGAVLSLVPMVRLRMRTMRMQISPQSPLAGATKMTIGTDGLTIERQLMRTNYAWGAFGKAIIEKGSVILTIDKAMGVIVPATTFQSDAERYEFAAEVSKRIPPGKDASGGSG